MFRVEKFKFTNVTNKKLQIEAMNNKISVARNIKYNYIRRPKTK